MKAAISGVTISPVNMDERKALGLKAGDTVRVHQKIEDKGKTRIQIFEGLVLARKHGDEPGATFTVRKVSSGVGVEKIYPLYSPMIDKIEIIRRAKVRRAKLYYIREKVSREIKRQMRRMSFVDLSTESGAEAAAREAAEAEAKAAEEAKQAEEAASAQAEAEAATPVEADTTEAAVEETATAAASEAGETTESEESATPAPEEPTEAVETTPAAAAETETEADTEEKKG